MIGVHLWIVDRKESVPLEGVWDRVGFGHQASVREVGVLDVLGQPVLDELGHLLGDGNLSTFHSVHQTQVPQPVVGDVVLVVLDRGEESLLSPEMLVVQGTLALSIAVIDISALGFLNLGAQSPLPELGVILADGLDVTYLAPWNVAVPGMAIFFMVLSVNIVGDGLRSALRKRVSH